MNDSKRRDRIVEYLRVKPISHGQVYTFQIAIPPSDIIEIPEARHQAIKRSLQEQGSNLFTIIVRRTKDYGEDEDYEVVFGADWCLVAKELEIEKLWVWVFDLTDKQAAAAKAEMEELVSYSGEKKNGYDLTEVVSMLQQFEERFRSEFEEQIKLLLTKIEELLNNKIKSLEEKLDGKLTEIESLITDKIQRLEEKVKINLSEPQLLVDSYTSKTVKELKEIARKRNIRGYSNMNKATLIQVLTDRERKNK